MIPHNLTVFEFMPYMGITLATIFTMLRLANEAKIRQAICGGECPTWACRSGSIRVPERDCWEGADGGVVEKEVPWSFVLQRSLRNLLLCVASDWLPGAQEAETQWGPFRRSRLRWKKLLL